MYVQGRHDPAQLTCGAAVQAGAWHLLHLLS
jgi:hypothetical protein